MTFFEMVHTRILRFAIMAKWINSLNLISPIFLTLQYNNPIIDEQVLMPDTVIVYRVNFASMK